MEPKVYRTYWKYNKTEGKFLMYDMSRKGKCIIEESWNPKSADSGERHHTLWAGMDGKKVGSGTSFGTFCGYDRGPKFDSRLEKIWKEMGK